MTREEAIEIIISIDKAYRAFSKEEYKALEMAVKALEQEQKTGHWIDDMSLGYHVSICSNCNWRGHGDTRLIYKPKYCPNCGAKMRK